MRLPDGWEKSRLDKIAFIQTGIAKNKKLISNAIQVPYLRVANVQDGYLDLSEIKNISIDEKKLDRFLVRTGDVLLTEGGDFDKLGRGAVWKGEIESCVHQNHVFVVRPNKEKILPAFLSSLTGSSYGKKYFLSCSKQSTNLASINSTQLKAFPVIFPPLPEQKAIADLLSTWDEAIEKTEKLIEAKEKRFRWLLNELIGKPAAEGREGWRKVKLGEICDVQIGRTPSRKNSSYWDTGCMTNNIWLSISDLGNSMKIFVSQERITDEAVRECGMRLVPENTVLMSFKLTLGRTSILGCSAYTNEAIAALLPKVKEYCAKYFLYFMQSVDWTRLVDQAAKGKTLNKRKLERFSFLLPSSDVQECIAESLGTAREEINLLNKVAERYRSQKRGLMQKLLAGAWRVKLEGA